MVDTPWHVCLLSAASKGTKLVFANWKSMVHRLSRSVKDRYEAQIEFLREYLLRI